MVNDDDAMTASQKAWEYLRLVSEARGIKHSSTIWDMLRAVFHSGFVAGANPEEVPEVTKTADVQNTVEPTRYRVREVIAMQFPGVGSPLSGLGIDAFAAFDVWLKKNAVAPCKYRGDMVVVSNPAVIPNGELYAKPGDYVIVMGKRMVVQDAEYFEATYERCP